MFLRKEVRKGKTSGTGKVLGRKKKKRKRVRTVFNITDTKINPIFLSRYIKKKKNQAIKLPKIIVT